MKKIEFSFICSKKFDDLEGDDNRKRYCRDCHKDVFNLDVMSAAERKKLADNAAKAGLHLCVAVTQRERINARPCSEDRQDTLDFVPYLGRMHNDRESRKVDAQQLRKLFTQAYNQFLKKP